MSFKNHKLLWALAIAIPCFFIACGWLARYPSFAAFVAGTVQEE